MNIYQFTTSNPTGQTEIWNTTENLNWISKQKKGRKIIHGDLNKARWDYVQPLNKDIGTADNKLQKFLSITLGGHSHLQQDAKQRWYML